MPNPSEIFEKLLAELASELPQMEKKIFDALKKNPAGLRREQLVAIVYGESVKAGTLTNSNTRDRKVRLAISRLRARLIPIVSSSGQAGYRLDISETARKKMLLEVGHRIDSLTDLNNRAAKFYNLPEFYRPAETSQQGRML